MSQSTHRVEIVPISLQTHPNADTLSIVTVFGYSVCVATKDWLGIDKGSYIVPDTMVPNSGPFTWLFNEANKNIDQSFYRVKVKKLRGIISMGLLIPAPEGSQIGDDVAGILGVKRYEPPEPITMAGDAETPPDIFAPKYNIENIYRYPNLFQPGELVYISEKIHGCNGRWTFHNGKFYAGSHEMWWKERVDNVWWKVLNNTPHLRDFLIVNPNLVLYGEVYGWVQDLRYGHTQGKVSLALFDVLEGTTWLDPAIARLRTQGLPWVPIIASGMPFNFESLKEIVEGYTEINMEEPHIREGIVVKPLQERTCLEIGRVALKMVSNKYLEKSK